MGGHGSPFISCTKLALGFLEIDRENAGGLCELSGKIMNYEMLPLPVGPRLSALGERGFVARRIEGCS